jgi:flavin-dependent dehydrogenase
MADAHDIAVLGASGAGYAAAIQLARQGLDVALLAGPASATESPLADWMPAGVFKDCPALRGLKSSGTDASFQSIVFHSADLAEQAAYRSRTVVGYFLHMQAWLSALEKSARKAGVKLARVDAPAGLELQEGGVRLVAERPIEARLLMIAAGSPMEIVTRLALPVRSVPTSSLTICGLDVPVTAAQKRALDKHLHVVALEGTDRLGVYFVAGGDLHVRIIFNTARVEAAAAGQALRELIAELAEAGLLPEGLDLARSEAALWRPPAGVALDLETHLAKRTLLIGTAGGFASALTGQTLDASIRSAEVAADVAARALDADRTQEILAEYKSLWRNELADRIRPPGTSAQMLLPMVLSNQAITTRFARAFLEGQKL